MAFTRAVDILFVPAVKKYSKSNNKKDHDAYRGLVEVLYDHPIMQQVEAESKENLDQNLAWGEFGEKKEKPVLAEPEELKISSKIVATEKWQKDFLVFKSDAIRSVYEKEQMERGELIHRIL